jgi:hypothetical protein
MASSGRVSAAESVTNESAVEGKTMVTRGTGKSSKPLALALYMKL